MPWTVLPYVMSNRPNNDNANVEIYRIVLEALNIKVYQNMCLEPHPHAVCQRRYVFPQLVIECRSQQPHQPRLPRRRILQHLTALNQHDSPASTQSLPLPIQFRHQQRRTIVLVLLFRIHARRHMSR
jgi:hypothetical protein